MDNDIKVFEQEVVEEVEHSVTDGVKAARIMAAVNVAEKVFIKFGLRDFARSFNRIIRENL